MKIILPMIAIVACTTGCINASGRAEGNRDVITEGMTKAEVQDELGPPHETFTVPGQPDDPRLPVELWRYKYRYGFWSYMAMIFLFPFGFALVDRQPFWFDIGFNREGRVTTRSPVTNK